jgi:adenylate kinase
MMILVISGTPGVGKTYIAKKLSKASGSRLKYFDLNKYIKENRLFNRYDRKSKTYDVDIKKIKKNMPKLQHSKDEHMDKFVNKIIHTSELIKTISKLKQTGTIIDSHLSHHLDCDYCIIVRSDIKTLNKRLEVRKYPRAKIQENIESEIFEVCLDEARGLNRKVIIIEN